MTDETVHPHNTRFNEARLDQIAVYLNADTLIDQLRATGRRLETVAQASLDPSYVWTPGTPYQGLQYWMANGIQTMPIPRWELATFNGRLGELLRALQGAEKMAAFVVPDEWMTGE